ncbi:MAG: hypothetical protein ACRDPY_18665 [Streptosporangiaceae bacterium]
MLLRLANLGVTNVFALLRLLQGQRWNATSLPCRIARLAADMTVCLPSATERL